VLQLIELLHAVCSTVNIITSSCIHFSLCNYLAHCVPQPSVSTFLLIRTVVTSATFNGGLKHSSVITSNLKCLTKLVPWLQDPPFHCLSFPPTGLSNTTRVTENLRPQLVVALRYNPEGRGFDSRFVNEMFHWHNPSDRTMVLGLTQPLSEMSTRIISWGKGGRCVGLTAVTYRGGLGVQTPAPKFRSFEKAVPNSQFRGKYIRNSLIIIQVSFISKINGTPD
jgi:hypothetical protein